jgi:phosphoribosylaminoimidazole-succinocarboxamide synthase
MELLRQGKVKEVYRSEEPGELEFVFTDNISVFDKIIPTRIPDKGESLCRTSAYWFGIVKDLGIGTHFLGLKSGNVMRVKKVDVIRDYSKITNETSNYLIPLEVICRYYLAGSLLDRVKTGKVPVESLGFPSGHKPVYGERLPEPQFEVTTKLEDVDRKIDFEEAKDIAGLTDSEFEDIRKASFKIDERIEEEVVKRGLIHVDGKKEFAFDENRKLMVIDTFGTADEDRWWDARIYQEENRCVELSKEAARQYYRRTGYFDELEKARADGREEPPIPGLPDDFVKEISDLYRNLYEQITGEKF